MVAEPLPGAPSRRSSWWARRSIRTRLTAATTVVVAAGMSLAATLLVWGVQGSLMGGLDAAVVEQAKSVAARVESGTVTGSIPVSDPRGVVVQVVSADGRVVAASDNVLGDARLFTSDGSADPIVSTVYLGSRHDGDADRAFRLATVAASGPRGAMTVYAAAPADPVADSTGELIAALGIGLPIVIAGMAVVGWLIVGRALRPVEALRTQATAIPGTDLSRRLPIPSTGDELARLAATFNELLGRIQAATDGQRQFVADAAHELRSPIASLSAQLEVAARTMPIGDADSGLLAGPTVDVERLTRLVDDLLALARLDAHPNPHFEPVDFDDIVLDEIRRHRGADVDVDASGVSAGRVRGDRAGLARIARNLLDNAVRHADRTVTVRLQSDGGTVTLTVADDGAGVPVADRERIFERFTRLDEARSHDAGGAGLGLAIVRDVARLHAGDVRVSDNHPGAVFTVTLPTGG
jgi:signal transduction histidine kinase